jgi:hypothetical protein
MKTEALDLIYSLQPKKKTITTNVMEQNPFIDQIEKPEISTSAN